MSLITKEHFERSQIKGHSYSNWALVEEGSLGTFTLGLMSTELGIKCSAYLLTLQRRARAAFHKTTTGANKENLFSGVNTNEPAAKAWRSADSTELRRSLVWQAAGTSVSHHCWLLFGQVAMARRVCICSTWELSWKEGRDRMGELNRAVSLQRHNNIYGI